MIRLTTFISLSLILAYTPALAAETTPKQKAVQIKETHADFGWFLYRFFNEPKFQLERVKFPLEKERFRLGEGTVKERITRADWKHMSGPPIYHCKMDCYHTVIYDNYSRKMRDSGLRVFAYEGLRNGILEYLYFRLIDGKWMLVQWDDFSS